MITRSKNTFSRWTFLKWILATLLIFAGLGGASRAGEKFTHDPFVPIDPIMPLSQVKPGMKGECLTVIKGSDIVSFNAEVVDIMSNLGSPKNLIIIKVSGPVVEATGGIASGMSGSPFYINRKLVGAIGYGWNFTDHFHCLVTPIEDMLEIWNNPEIIPSFGLAPVIANTPQSEESDLQESISHRAASEDVTSAGDDDATCARDELPQDVVIEEISPASPDIPISRDIVITRDISLSGDIKASWDLLVSRDRAASWGKPDSRDSVFISGVSNRIASNITEVMGVEAAPFAGASGGSSKTINYDPDIRPGMTIGTSFLWGDVELSAMGTLTAVSRDGRFIGYAHPILRLGPTAAVLMDANISAVIPGLNNSFKLGTTGDIIGIVTQDRPQGIGGRIGRFAPAASFVINLTDIDSGRSYRRAFQMVQDKYLLSSLSSLAVVGCVEDLWGRSGGGSAKVTATYAGSALKDGWKRTNVFVSETDVTKQMLAEFSLLTQMFAVNPFQELRPFGVSVDVEVTQEPRVLYIEDVKIQQKGTLRPGDTVSFDITLRPWRKDPFVRTYSLKVPNNVTGIAQLFVRGGGIAEETAEYHELGWRSISSLPILLRELDAKETNDQMVMEIRGQEALSAQIARAREGAPDDLMNDKLGSEIREEKMQEGSMRVVRTNYYVDGLIHKLIRIKDGKIDDDIPFDEADETFDDIEDEDDYDDE